LRQGKLVTTRRAPACLPAGRARRPAGRARRPCRAAPRLLRPAPPGI